MKKVMMMALALGLSGSILGCAKKQTVKSDAQPVTTPAPAPAEPVNHPPPN